MAGALELEDEDGRAVRTSPDDLLEPLRRSGRPLPLVLLNTCHGGVQDGQTASFAEALLRAGVPAVLAMQTSVSDSYATGLARSFYHQLANRAHPLVSRALAAARKELEHRRLAAIQRGASLAETQPEYATASLFVAGDERPLADFGLVQQRLQRRAVYDLAGPVPQLRIDDLIGRRRELRETLRELRDESRQYAGVVLTGLGGVGKSAVAGRTMQRLTEDGWLVATQAGRFNLTELALVLGTGLMQSEREPLRQRGELLVRSDLADPVRLRLLAQTLAEEQVLLVLDDFEQNLTTGGDAWLDPDAAVYFSPLAENARRGRLLITSRYPIPDTTAFLHRISIGPLSRAESGKLLLRLPALRGTAETELAMALRIVGGHPRMMEFLDALLRGGQGRLPGLTRKLRTLLPPATLAGPAGSAPLAASLDAALLLGARDVFLDELLDLARREAVDEALLQAATSNLPVSPDGLARMLDDQAPDFPAAECALARLADLSLVHRFPDRSAWVHRWTAEGLIRLADAGAQQARYRRSGRYWIWRVGQESHSLEDAVEAVRSFLAGQDFDAAVEVAAACFDALRRFQQSMGLAALAAEVLETLPESHPGFAGVADEEGQAHLALGFTDRALRRYQRLVDQHASLAAAEPDRADYQHDLSVSYLKVGDLYRALGQGEQARQAYRQSLAIRERLAAAEPDRADYQRDVALVHERLGDLDLALGQKGPAGEFFAKALEIRERVAAAEPDRADYQRELVVPYARLGDLYEALDQGELARKYQMDAHGILERLAAAEPARADYQRDLAASLATIGASDGADSPEQLQRALSILEGLKDSGRLSPVDEPMIPALREMLRERGLAS